MRSALLSAPAESMEGKLAFGILRSSIKVSESSCCSNEGRNCVIVIHLFTSGHRVQFIPAEASIERENPSILARGTKRNISVKPSLFRRYDDSGRTDGGFEEFGIVS